MNVRKTDDFIADVFSYEIASGEVVMRRAVHGRRDLPRRLLEPPRQD